MKEIGNTQLYLTVLFESLKAILLHSKLTHLVKWLTIWSLMQLNIQLI